ncbi:MAG: acetoacetate--CoA ligase, partial [Alphaproteobacteria bacterium]
MARSNMVRFMEHAGLEPGTDDRASDALYDFSLADMEAFWSAVWDFCGVIGDKGPKPWLVDADKMPGAGFFPAASLNYAENLLSREGPQPAIIFRGETGAARAMSWDTLR